MIRFKQISIEGFGSIINPLTYNLDSPGINIIRGDNGTGKTTIINAIPWALYGQVIKKDCSIKPWPEVMGKNYRGTKVEVIYSKNGVERKIIHLQDWQGKLEGSSGKNRLLIYVDGVFQASLRDKKDGWRWITQDLGWTFELFKNSIVFGQKVKRLIEEDGPKRNLILEKAFEVSYISQAKNKIDQILREDKPIYENTLLEVSTLSKYLQDLTELQNEQRNLKQQFYKKQAEILDDYHNQIKGLEIKISELLKNSATSTKIQLQQEIEECRGKIKKLEALKDKDIVTKELKLNFEVNDLKLKYDVEKDNLRELKKSILSVPTSCIACGSKLNSTKIKEQKSKIQKAIDKSLKTLKELTARIRVSSSKHTEALGVIASQDKLNSKIIKLEYKLKALEAQYIERDKLQFKVKLYKKQIKGIKAKIQREEKVKFKSQLKKLKKKITKAKKAYISKKSELAKLKKKMEINEWLVKDPLSNNGLKAFIFSSMLKQTNLELKKYSPLLGFDIEININLENKRKDLIIQIFRDKLEVPHEDLSGGEKQLADVCIAFSIHETISGDKGSNLLILDEVFESLDKNNVEKVGNLLMKKSSKKSVHVITHITHFNPIGAKVTHLIKTPHYTTEVLAAKS